MTKRKILVLADSPTVCTGFANVSRNVLKSLYDTGRYEIDMVGINYFGDYDKKEFEEKYYFLNKIIPAKHPASNDLYGRELTKGTLLGYNKTLRPPYDIFFTIQDHFILSALSAENKTPFANSIKNIQKTILDEPQLRPNHFTWIGYFPVDSTLKEEWVNDSINKADYPVAYCDYGKKEILKINTDIEKRLKIIRHGTNTSEFYPIEDKNTLRHKYFKDVINDDTFLLINVNRNQPRKDLFRTLMIYREFKKKVPNSFLYMHCKQYDQGGDLVQMSRNLGLDPESWGRPSNFDESKGIPVDILNELYNCADAYITTTLGEGWGLGITEAMATKTPVYAPNITSIPEILGNGSRGSLFEAGDGNNVINMGMSDNDIIRPVTNIYNAVDVLYYGYTHKQEIEKKTQQAYKWATELTWELENKKWIKLFDEACLVNDYIRSGASVSQEIKQQKQQKPNDKCACGSNIKYKKCHGK